MIRNRDEPELIPRKVCEELARLPLAIAIDRVYLQIDAVIRPEIHL